MPQHRLADMTWEEVDRLDGPRTVAILPVGAVEAHGPHLPLSTDVIIAEAMAWACARELDAAGRTALVLPPLWYTEAGFAQAFAGTVSVEGSAVKDTVLGVARSMARAGVGTLAVANAHLDPAHLRALAVAVVEAPPGCAIVCVDLTRRDVAGRLTEEFRSGACHAGRYEGSVVLAEAPELVRRDIAARLPANPASLVDAIRAGLGTFTEAGGPRAYFGAPAEATAEEGRETIRVLGTLLGEAVLAAEGDR
jgi:creatinine amidohydrolase